jgi:hypothetical protein
VHILYTIFRCYLVTFKIIPPSARYSELFQKFSRYWTICWRGGEERVRVHFICTVAVGYNLQLFFNLFNLIIFLLLCLIFRIIHLRFRLRKEPTMVHNLSILTKNPANEKKYRCKRQLPLHCILKVVSRCLSTDLHNEV